MAIKDTALCQTNWAAGRGNAPYSLHCTRDQCPQYPACPQGGENERKPPLSADLGRVFRYQGHERSLEWK